MMGIPPLLILMTPALPPSGPIWGQIECLFGAGEAMEAATVRFNEDGIPRLPSPFPLLDETENTDEPQVELSQFPVDGNKLSGFEFAADNTITLQSEGGRNVAGIFRPLRRSGGSERWWMEFSVPDAVGSMKSVGQCIAEFNGRLERPIRLTTINTFRIDVEKP